MDNDQDKKQKELKELEEELKKTGLSRRKFLNRLKGLGIGFGAAFMLGVRDADALTRLDAGVSVKSTNPAVDDILAEGAEGQLAEAGEADDPRTHMAQYGRIYRRGYRRYRRVYRRYRRGYRRYARIYRRYRRGYGRYSRVYFRF